MTNLSTVDKDIADKFTAAAQMFEALEEPASLSTTDVVQTYHILNSLYKGSEHHRENYRKVLLERRGDGEPKANGNIVFQAGKVVLEARARITATLNEERAKEELEKKELLDIASETETVITDPVKLTELFDRVQEFLVQRGEVQMAQEMSNVMTAATDRRVSISEEKLLELVKKNKLTMAEVETWYDKSTTYALFDTSK